MSFKPAPHLKVGIFVSVIIVILAYATLRVSQKSILPGGTYDIFLLTDSAEGINKKTPVQVAGIQVGAVSEIGLVGNNQAKITLEISRKVKLSKNAEARIKTIGFLGDTYIELFDPSPSAEKLSPESTIRQVTTYGDLNAVMGEIGSIAGDVKAITATMKTLMAGEDSAFARSLNNIEKITSALERVSTRNESEINAIVANLRAMSENLNLLVARNISNVDTALGNTAEITEKIRRGEGTIGRLINDDETVEKLNESIEGLNNLLGGVNRLQVDLGYHTEYLGESEDFKHYVSLALKPKPDKAFLFDFVSDPAPAPVTTLKDTTITSGGTTTTVSEEIETVSPNKFRFSAQFAKKYYDFTFRGGIIESSGGAGVDYNYGPAGLQFSAFDFQTTNDRRPHLKTMGTVNVTRSLYLLGGLDDFVSKQQDPDWFLGAGVKFSDDDLKSLIGLMSVKP